PLPVEIILDRARRALNQEGYNLVYSNCEHFATECRYGQPNSRQVQVAAGASAAVGILMAATMVCTALVLSGPAEKTDEEKNSKAIQTKK
ncbi:unnamed protein product, partial [Rotaria socialis]